MSQRDISLAEQLETLSIDTLKIKTYLVLSANTQLQSMKEAVRAFRQTTLNGTILTKVDESASLGNALSVMLQYRLPVAYVGTGQRVPEDILPARADFLVEQAVTLSEPEDEDEEKFAVAFARPVTARC
jgi:flagellar biosynthesis protein FlhF